MTSGKLKCLEIW